MSNLIIWCTKCGKEIHFDNWQEFKEELSLKEENEWYYCKECHEDWLDDYDDEYDNPFGWEEEEDEEDY